MRPELLFTSETHQDIDDAYDWYEKRRYGLGDRFLASVRKCIDRILDAPLSFAVVERDYRRAMLNRYPYAIIYEYDGRYVTVYAVIHTSRDLGVWRGRLP